MYRGIIKGLNEALAHARGEPIEGTAEILLKKYLYPAIFAYADDGISVSFPDLPGCFTCGWSDAESMHMAEDALKGHIICMLDDGESLPEPTPMEKICPGENEKIFIVEICIE